MTVFSPALPRSLPVTNVAEWGDVLATRGVRYQEDIKLIQLHISDPYHTSPTITYTPLTHSLIVTVSVTFLRGEASL